MFTEKESVIEKLTGVKASKKSYYTDLKKTIEALEKKNQKLEILNEVAKGFQLTGTMERSLQHILETIYELYPIDRVSISLIENDVMTLQSIYPVFAKVEEVGLHLPPGRSIYWKAINQDLIVIHEWEPGASHRFVEEQTLADNNLYHACVIPLRMKTSTIGVLTFATAERIDYDYSDITFFRQLSDHIAVMVENSRLYREVSASKKEWEETFQAVADLLILTDTDHRIIRCNQASYHFFNQPPASMTGLRCHDVLFPEDHTFCPIEESYHTQSMKNYQMTLKNGSMCDIQTYPVRGQTGEMKGLLIYIKDITEKIRTQAQLQHSGQLAAIGEMAAGVAHELNSPLTAVIGNTQILKRQLSVDGSSLKLAEAIERGGKRCQGIIRNLLSFSRPEKEESTECCLNESVEDVLSLIGFQIERENIQIKRRFSKDIPLVEASPHQIGQIIINLLLNAKDALAGEEEPKYITLSTCHTSKYISLFVEDNGCGITDDKKDIIFDPFFTTKEKQSGTGLGLSVSRDLAERNEGSLVVTSKAGRGSTFELKLPIVPHREVED